MHNLSRQAIKANLKELQEMNEDLNPWAKVDNYDGESILSVSPAANNIDEPLEPLVKAWDEGPWSNVDEFDA